MLAGAFFGVGYFVDLDQSPERLSHSLIGCDGWRTPVWTAALASGSVYVSLFAE